MTMSAKIFMSRLRSLLPRAPKPKRGEHDSETACSLFGEACKAERRGSFSPFPVSEQLARERADDPPPPPKTFSLAVNHR